MPRWCWRRTRPTWPIPRSANCFWRRNGWPSHGALLCRRRPRAAGQEPIWAVHVVSVEGDPESPSRNMRPIASAFWARPDAGRAGGAGAGRDAVRTRPARCSIRFSASAAAFRLEAGGALSLLICTGVAKSREEALATGRSLPRRHRPSRRVFDLAWAHSQVELRHLQITTADVHLFQRLATHLLYAGPALRAAPEVLAANRQGQPGLWRYGISGDNPILLVRVAATEDLPLVRHLLLAHSYWHMKSFAVDLVILSEQAASYVEELFQQIQEAVRSSHSHALADKPGGVFVRKALQMPEEDQVLLQAAARVVLLGRNGSLAVQLTELVDRTAPVEAAAPLPERFRRISRIVDRES